MFKFIFGKRCLVCRFEEENIEYLCNDCFKKLKTLHFGRLNGKTYILFAYKSIVRSLILNGKYRFNKNIWRLWDQFYKDLPFKTDNVIIYIPTTFKRFCYRGFNQSYLIAKGLERAGYGKVVSIIKRKKFNKSTSLLNKSERVLSIKDNFVLKDNFRDILGENILIVDDVLTTGATMREIENLLVENGFKKSKIKNFTLASGRLNAY